MGDPLGRFAGHVLLDAPADLPALNYPQIADALAGIIRTSPPRFAVGIFGGWGSGKSTLMDAIRREVDLSPDIITVEFNAWRYEREPHLIIPLLDTVRGGVWRWSQRQAATTPEREAAWGIAGRIGRVVRALARATRLEVGVPGAVKLMIDPAEALDQLTEEDETDEARDPQSLYFAAFQHLSEAFDDVTTTAGISRIVVFVDDLDRCMPEQALDVLESMKLFFDMRGFVFVVGLDERVVESAVHSKFTYSSTGQPDDVVAQIERDYLKKIFQVPYTLPPMVSDQLDELLWSIEHNGDLSEIQAADLRTRVRRYLRYVAVEGRINPREVKRFINAYTLGRMIRQDLEPDVILALQTLDFRSDWERLYDDVILAEPDFAGAIIREFRTGNDNAFEDLWPTIGVIPLDLSSFLRSPDGAPLANPDLARYVAFLETTRTSHSWLPEALQTLGVLRRGIREIETTGSSTGDPWAPQVAASELTDALNRLIRVTSLNDPLSKQLEPTVDALRRLIDRLGHWESGARTSDLVKEVTEWAGEVRQHLEQLQQQLRILRRSATFS